LAPIRVIGEPRSLNSAIMFELEAVRDPFIMWVFSKLNPVKSAPIVPMVVAESTVTVAAVPEPEGPPATGAAHPIVGGDDEPPLPPEEPPPAPAMAPPVPEVVPPVPPAPPEPVVVVPPVASIPVTGRRRGVALDP
jgi:hypothetical protein